MKRGLALFLAALLTALALTACGGGGGSGNTSSAATSGGYEIAEDSSAPMDWGFYDEATGTEEPTVAPEAEEKAQTNDRLANAKMVYSADVQAETTDFDQCASGLETLVEQMGGYLEYASVGTYSSGLRSGTYTVRIPSARFKPFLKSVGELSHITNQDQRSENISERYYDTESRLTTQKTKLERLQTLLAKAEDMEDIIALESAIAETELEIEQLTGSLRHYDALVDFATIEFYLREVSRLSTVEEAPPTFANQLGNAFVEGIYSFGEFLQDVAIFLAYNWTWLLLLVVIAAAVVTLRRRRRARQPESFREAKAGKVRFFRRKEKDSPDSPKNPDDKQP